MSAAWILALLAPAQVSFVESYVDMGTEAFSYQIQDLDGDGRGDLIVSLIEDHVRRLLVHRQSAGGSFSSEPDWRMRLPLDVVSYALMDVREEPGLEILLLAQGGLFSVSPANASLRGNLRKELSLPLFPDLAEDAELPLWELFADVDADGEEELLVISEGELVALGRRSSSPSTAGSEAALFEKTRLPCLLPEEQRLSSGRARLGFGWAELEGSDVSLPYFAGSFTSRTALPRETWFLSEVAWRLPALQDWTGDGRVDAIFARDGGLELLPQGPEGRFERDGLRPIELPASLDDPDEWEVRLVDYDGDGRDELALVREDDEEHVLLIVGRSPSGVLDEQPRGRVKIAGLGVDFLHEDVDRDGNLDLVVRRADIPEGVTQASKARLDVTLLVYRGEPGGRLGRRPALRFERSFRPEDMARGEESRILDLSGDFDGDGLNDLLLLQPSGLLEITPLRPAGEGWKLGDEPLARYQPPSRVWDAQALELASDRVSDLALRHDEALTLFVSRAGGKR